MLIADGIDIEVTLSLRGFASITTGARSGASVRLSQTSCSARKRGTSMLMSHCASRRKQDHRFQIIDSETVWRAASFRIELVREACDSGVLNTAQNKLQTAHASGDALRHAVG
jgi:hypothetical protein